VGTALSGTTDAFVTKLNLTGTGLIYSTYLGGTGPNDALFGDQGFGIALDTLDNAYVTGQTTSTNFPTTAGAFDTTLGGFADAFVTKMDPAGALSDSLRTRAMPFRSGTTARKAGGRRCAAPTAASSRIRATASRTSIR
jgi:hypothetical protein